MPNKRAQRVVHLQTIYFVKTFDLTFSKIMVGTKNPYSKKKMTLKAHLKYESCYEGPSCMFRECGGVYKFHFSLSGSRCILLRSESKADM